MARIIDTIKPDWSVVRYETEKDFRDHQEKKGLYELSRGLLITEEDFCPDQTISQIMVIVSTNHPRVRVKMYPCIKEMTELEELVGKINSRFINNEWHVFPSYEQMVKKVAKDYEEWLQYAGEKNEWDLEQTWSPTDAGYNLVFPIWRDVERVINQ